MAQVRKDSMFGSADRDYFPSSGSATEQESQLTGRTEAAQLAAEHQGLPMDYSIPSATFPLESD